MPLSWKISGEAGFGITTIGQTFAKLVSRHGYHIWSYAEYPSLIRGGFTTLELSISDRPYRTLKSELDFHIVLRQDGYDRDKSRICENTVLLYDKDTVKIDGSIKCIALPMPYKEIKAKHKAPQVMVNTVSIGATIAIFGWDINAFFAMIGDEFSRKGSDVVDFNKKLAQEGFDFVNNLINADKALHANLKQSVSHCLPDLDRKQYAGINSTKLVMTGNDAFALGSMIAGIKSYCAYPMSPSSTVLSTLAAWSKKADIVVRHTEDEIAAINESLGFSYAGVRSAVGTSGGGFALMVEALSYAGVAEMPIVTYLVQRPGPATGLPTWTGQGDLMFAVHAGHGEFMKIVLAAGDNEEMIHLSALAYNMADVFQTPVIVVADRLLGESLASIEYSWFHDFRHKYKIDRGQIKNEVTIPYKRYQVTDSGISDYLIPGAQKGVFWQANSYEHQEDSHTTEDAVETVKQVDKRARKIKTYLSSEYYCLPIIFGDETNAEITFVSYGTNKHSILSSMKDLLDSGIKTSYIHFTHLYPLHKDKVANILSSQKRLVFVENGSVGQLAKLLSQEGCLCKNHESILKYDGRPITKSDIINFCLQK